MRTAAPFRWPGATAGAIVLCVVCAATALTAQNPSPGKAKAPQKPAPAAAANLAPKIIPGQALRYQLEFHTTSQNRHEGLVQDPQSASQLEILWNAVVRVEFLSLGDARESKTEAKEARAGADAVRIRTTYEKSSASVKSDSFDPAAAIMEKQYQNLEGHSIEFTLNPDGTASDVTGLEDVVIDQQAEAAAEQWVSQLALGAGLPAGPLTPGQHWSSERPATSAPLAGIVWKTTSTYLRDDSCRAALAAASGSAASASRISANERCAVVQTELEMGQPKPLRDATPEDYRKRGLHTSGTWHGTGESRAYISRSSGWVVNSSQSGSEQMDFIVASVDGASHVHYAGKVTSKSQITLLDVSTASQR